MKRGGNAISFFIFSLIFFLAWFFFCIPLYICQESKGTKTSGYLCNLAQLSGRYSQTKTAPVRFYFTLARRAIITKASVIILLMCDEGRLKEISFGRSIKKFEPYVLLMKIWNVCHWCFFTHKGKCGIAVWHSCSDVWCTWKNIETSLKHFTQMFIAGVFPKTKKKKKGNHKSCLSTSSWLG